jgi:hypothetical protein
MDCPDNNNAEIFSCSVRPQWFFLIRIIMQSIAGISTGGNNGNTIFQEGPSFSKTFIIYNHHHAVPQAIIGTKNPVMAYNRRISSLRCSNPYVHVEVVYLLDRWKMPICGYATKKSLLRYNNYDISEEAGPWFYGVGFSRNSILGYGSQLLIRGTWFLMCILSRKDSSHKFYNCSTIYLSIYIAK